MATSWKILSNRVQHIRNNLLAETFHFPLAAWCNSKLGELSNVAPPVWSRRFTWGLKALCPSIFLASFGDSLTSGALLQDVSFCPRNKC